MGQYFVFKEELKPLKAKFPAWTSAFFSVFPKLTGLWTKSHHTHCPSPGGGVVPWAVGPPKFWQKRAVFLTLGERIKQMECAMGLGYRPCQMQPFMGEAGGKGALSLACSLGPRSPKPHFHFSFTGHGVNPHQILPSPSLPRNQS